MTGTYCNCPLECEATLYSQEMSQADRRTGLETDKYMEPPLFQKMRSQKHLAIHILDKKIKEKMDEGIVPTKLMKLRDDILDSASVVHFYFKERGIVQYSREQLYSIMDVIGKSSSTLVCSLLRLLDFSTTRNRFFLQLHLVVSLDYAWASAFCQEWNSSIGLL